MGSRSPVALMCSSSPDRRYDAVFFAFWLSHVPLERFASFWSTVADCLTSNGPFVWGEGHKT